MDLLFNVIFEGTMILLMYIFLFASPFIIVGGIFWLIYKAGKGLKNG